MTADPLSRPRAAKTSAVAYNGVLMLDRVHWVVAADAPTMIMLKRVFPRIDESTLEQVRIKRSDEVDKLLQWFCDLMPLQASARDLAALHRGAEANRERTRMIRAILDHDYTPADFPGIAVDPRDYQRLAADMWLRMGGLLLADETGTGKTISALTGLSDERTHPATVVVPGNNLARQWGEQIERCFPGARVYLAKGTVPVDLTRLPGGWPTFVVIPYHLLGKWGDMLVRRTKAVVFDEVAELRHADTDKYRAARALAGACTYTLGMSATPSYNYGGEYHAILDVVRPGCAGTWDEFDREHCVGEDEKRKKRIKNPKAFGLWLDQSGIRLARTRRDVGRELPKLTIVPTYIDADPALYGRHMSGAAACARTILEQSMGAGAGHRKMMAAAEFDAMMRQATGIAKAKGIAGFVRMLVESGERPVVFAHHLSVYDLLAEDLKDLAPGFVTGRESDRAKQESIARFTTPDAAGRYQTDVLILGLRAQAAGLDGLQFHSDVVVIAELDWSPKIHHQAISRVDRDRDPVAPNRPVVAYYLLSELGSDPIVAEVCGAKDANTTPISYPDAQKIDAPTVDVNRARRLAEAYLARR